MVRGHFRDKSFKHNAFSTTPPIRGNSCGGSGFSSSRLLKPRSADSGGGGGGCVSFNGLCRSHYFGLAKMSLREATINTFNVHVY